MTIPEDVREVVLDALYSYKAIAQGIQDVTGESREDVLAAVDAALAWLDAQPEAPEPDWTTAPDWAQWWAVDADGLAYWYGIVPPTLSPTHDMWDTGPDGFDTPIGYIDLPLGIDWRTTLRTRPQS